MTNEDFDTIERNKNGFVKFNTLPKYAQILIMGLIIGGALFGGYLVIMGVNNMITPPEIINSGTITGDYPVGYEMLYYKSDKHYELVITNHEPWNVKVIWIGTPEEYQAYRDGKLMDGVQHIFKSEGLFDKNSIKYKTDLPYYNYQQSILSQLSGSKKELLIKAGSLDVGDKTNIRYYTVTMHNNVTTSPSISIMQNP